MLVDQAVRQTGRSIGIHQRRLSWPLNPGERCKPQGTLRSDPRQRRVVISQPGGSRHTNMAIETASVLEVAAAPRASAPIVLGHSVLSERVRVDGKHFRVGNERFAFRGVTYGTFAARPDGAQFPKTEQLRKDLESIADAGFTVVRTYTPPPSDMLDAAAEVGLRVLAGLNYQDWRYLLGSQTD